MEVKEKGWLFALLLGAILIGVAIGKTGNVVEVCKVPTTANYGSRDIMNTDFTFPWPQLLSDTTEITVSVQGEDHAFILLSPTNTPVDEVSGDVGISKIMIGGSGNTKSGLVCNRVDDEWTYADTPNILDSSMLKEFFVRWDPMTMVVEVGEVGQAAFLTVTSTCPVDDVKYIGIASGWGADAQWGSCVNATVPPLRLAGGTSKYAGRLEVFLDGTWGTICKAPFGFYSQEEKVACRHMGLPHSNAKLLTLTPDLQADSDVPMHWSNLDCNPGDEENLLFCDLTSPVDASCTHDDDAGVTCSNVDSIGPGFIQTYDGVFDYSNSDNPVSVLDHRVFRVQEGAVVKFICPTDGQLGVNTQTNDDHMTMHWELGGHKMTTKNNAPDGVDVEDFVQMYQNRGLGFNGRRGKRVSIVTYTARKEDTLKVLQCKIGDEDPIDSVYTLSFGGAVASIKLLVLPPPPPLKFQSTILHVWQGGFIGDILIPIDSFYNSWKMILKFPKPVFRLYGGNFNIAEEPCLHEGSCSKSHKTWIIYNTYENRVLSPLKDLHLTFIADVSKKLNRGRGRGLEANIKFYGYNKVFASDAIPIWEPWE